MADIDALKNRIRSNVKSNDNQEITGPVMQETLLDMTRELDPSLEEQRAKDAEAALNRGLTHVTEEVDKKPDVVDISQYHNVGDELPLSACYLYNGTPTYSRSGHCVDTGDDFIAICNYNWDIYPSIFLYVKNAQNKYIYYSSFHTIEAETPLELFVASLFEGTPVTYENNGLMKASDKVVFDEMVTEVFPLTVGVVSSNAGAREIGTPVTPQIVLSITRKGTNIPAIDITETITPPPASVSSDKRTITGNPVSSGTTTYQISVSQGGQTRSIPNQVFKFLNYVYGGELSSKPANSSAVKTQIELWGSSHGVLSDKKNSTAITSDGKIALSATKYYLFAVKQLTQNVPVTLIVKNANSGGTIDVPSSDKGSDLVITRVNHSGTDFYSWIIVPASSNSWNFQIVNS